MSGGEKTEKPTEKKKKEAKKEGRIARTPDLGSWGGLFVASLFLPMVISKTMDLGEQLMYAVRDTIKNPDPGTAVQILGDAMIDGALAVAPVALGMMCTAIVAAAAQGGLKPAMKLMKPDFKRLNPFSGLKKVFGPHALWEGVKTLVKTAVLGAVLYYSLKDLLPQLLTSASLPLPALLDVVLGTITALIRAAAGAGLVMAVADYAVARRRIDKQLKMSKDEIKREHKSQEGDPHLKGAIRSKQMAMSRQRMMSDLSKADVVMVNPTHVAVALRYDPTKGAPRVVAKGAGATAAKIREVAAEKRIPMVQDVPLARSLYKACEIGQEIPAELYGAVARVLAFVMTLKAKGAAAGLHRSPAMSR